MILSMIGRPSARESGVCLFRENKESSRICGNLFPSEVQVIELAFPLMERGSWLGVHRVAGSSSSGSVEIVLDGAESLLRVHRLKFQGDGESNRFNALSKSALNTVVA